MIKKLLVFTECSPSIGLGHIVECQSIVETWKTDYNLEESFFFVEGDAGIKQFLESRNLNYQIKKNSLISKTDVIKNYDAILVNKKNVPYDLLKSLSRFNKMLLVFDELGEKKITADYLINFSINPRRHNYIFPDKKPITLFGPKYFPAGKMVLEALKTPKPKNSKTIVVSMGGFDNSRITDKVMKALKQIEGFQKEIILGPGFQDDFQFKNLLKTLDGSFKIYTNVHDLPQRIRNARFLVNSGGNTVYESIILETPVLIIGEDPHEKEQGEIFASRNCAVNIKKGKEAEVKQIEAGLKKVLLQKWDVKNKMSVTPWYPGMQDK